MKVEMNWKERKVLVIGGGGFIGSRLSRRLFSEGAYVTVLDDFSYGKKENIPPDCDIVVGDVSNGQSLNKIKEEDYIFHFGAPSSVILFNKNPRACIHSTICGFANILEWGKQIGVKKLIYPSSGSVYGDVPPPQSENLPPKPKNLYGICKLTCELLARKYSEVPSVGLRVFAGYGPGEEHKGDFSSVITLFLNSILKNEPPVVYGNGMQSRDFVYIDDVIDAILSAAERDVSGEILNVGSGKAYSFNDVVSTINHLTGKNIEPVFVNKPANYLENTLADVKKMRRLLCINPLDLEEGLKRYLQEVTK